MIKTILLAAMAALTLYAPSAANAEAVVGQPAPEFTGTDSRGQTHTLSAYRGKTVVLEWHNPECPYVVKHYDSKNMQKLQEEATGKGIIWLTVNSSAEGKQGYATPEDTNALIEKQGAKATARLIDKDGTIGKLYGAQTTPHMFVINPEGTLVYAGAIDSDSSFRPETIAGATNYVQAALNAIEQGQPVEVSSTQPYGCAVKY